MFCQSVSAQIAPQHLGLVARHLLDWHYKLGIIPTTCGAVSLAPFTAGVEELPPLVTAVDGKVLSDHRPVCLADCHGEDAIGLQRT